MIRYCSLFLLFFSIAISAQTLRVELPAHAGKEMKLSVRCAITSDTIVRVLLDKDGLAAIDFAGKQTRVGLATLTIKPDVNYEFVLSPNESPTIRSTEKIVNPRNVKIENSVENLSIDRLFARFMFLKAKQEAFRPMLKLYLPSDGFYPELIAEQKRVSNAVQLFNDSLQTNPLYAAKFIEVRQLVNEKIENAWQSDTLKAEIRDYVLNRLDVNFVFGSGMYFNLFNGLNMYVYQKESMYHKEFGNDMVKVLSRVEPLDIFTTLSIDLLTICEKLSWDSEAEKIVDFVLASKRIPNPTGKLKLFVKQHGVRDGKPAPILITTGQAVLVNDISFQKSKQGTIVVFYESGCSHCEKEIKKLTELYPKLVAKGVQVVTISSDHDKTIFEKGSKDFPWPGKLCDLKSMAGPNFQNYGIIGTPTMYLVDKKGTILVRTAQVDDLMAKVK